MSKLYYNSEDSHGINGDLMGIISTFCIMFCMIVTVLGIKFKWFKHRMNFEEIPQTDNNTNKNNNSINNGGDKFRNTSKNRLSLTMQGHGVFRKLQDDEIPIERPKSLPPIRIKNTSRQQLHLTSSNVNMKNDTIEQIPKPENCEIFKNMKFNKFPTDIDLFPKVHQQQKTNPKLRQDRSKSPKNNISPIKDNSQLSIKQSPTRQHRSKSPQKEQKEKLKENPSISSVNLSNPTKSSNDKRIKRNQNSLKLDIEATKTIENVVKLQQVEKRKEEKNVKFVENSPQEINKILPTEYLEEINLNDDEILKEISTRRPTGFVRPTKEEIDELENFDNIIDEIDQQYPGTLQEKHGQLVFKIDGFSDNEDDKNCIKSIPIPEPRITIRKSLENDLQNHEVSNNLVPLASLNNDENNNKETDSWSAVRQHRNLTQEMAKHHQAIRDAAQIKAAKRQLKNPLAYDLDLNQKSNLNGTDDNKYQQKQKDDKSIHNFICHEPRFSNNSTEA